MQAERAAEIERIKVRSTADLQLGMLWPGFTSSPHMLAYAHPGMDTVGT